jgi:hypothetical protein
MVSGPRGGGNDCQIGELPKSEPANKETVGRYLRLAKPAISTTGMKELVKQNQPF